MRLGKASAYAFYAAAHLAANMKKQPIQGDVIADALDIPVSHLMKVLQQLVRARILESERGPHGGFSLRRDPARITLLEILEAVDGPLNGDVAGSRNGLGKTSIRNVLESRCGDVADYARSVFSKVTLKALLK